MSEYYGDYTRWFIGRVVSINDPLKLGRVRVRIFGIHSSSREDIPEADLPWAQTIVPVTEGGSSGIGTNVGIKEQAQVFGIFLDGTNSQLPLVMGSIPKIESKAGTRGYSRKTDDPEKIDLTGSSNAEKAYNWFISKEGGDFTPEQAAGILGNLLKESGPSDLNPLATNPTDAPGGSHGIAQWNRGRYTGLLDYSAERNLDPRSLEAQLQWLTYELFNDPYESRILNDLKSATSVEQAALVFEGYERPAGWSYSSRSLSAQDRIELAEVMYGKMETA